jgi:molybdate transport system permease protein
MPGGDAAVWRLAAVSVALSLAALVVSEALSRSAGQGRGGHVL